MSSRSKELSLLVQPSLTLPKISANTNSNIKTCVQEGEVDQDLRNDLNSNRSAPPNSPKLTYIKSSCSSMTPKLKAVSGFSSNQAKHLVKNNEAQRPWEFQALDAHPIEQIQLLEQAAKRLVAKSKEMLEPLPDVGVEYETGEPKRMVRKGYLVKAQDVDEVETQDLKWVHDLLVDAAMVIERVGEKRKLMRKWEAKRKMWIKEGLIDE